MLASSQVSKKMLLTFYFYLNDDSLALIEHRNKTCLNIVLVNWHLVEQLELYVTERHHGGATTHARWR